VPQFSVAKTLSKQIRVDSRPRGSSAEFWRDLDAVKKIARKAGLERTPLPTTFLSVGPCPGRWRVYYSIISDPASVPRGLPEGVTSFLGRPTESRTEDALGTDFERWTNDANRVMNQLAATGGASLPLFDRIETPELRQFFERRTHQILAEHSPDEIRQLLMRVDLPIEVFPGLPIAAPNPDGTFDLPASRAVFESKLHDPRGHPLFRAKMAAYALSAEKAFGGQYDYGVVLHAGGVNGPPDAYAFEIDGGDVGSVSQQLTKLRILVETSWASWPHRKQGRALPRSWAELLDRPRPGKASRKGDWKPTGGAAAPCRSDEVRCPFFSRCWAENGWL